MLISIKDKTNPDDVIAAISTGFSGTRFTIGAVEQIGPRRIKLREIRLVEKKKYCGNHPGECLLPQSPGQRSQGQRQYLEGLDWVDFNDHLNDVFDAMSMNARVRSSEVEIRQGLKRRVMYGSHLQGRFMIWDVQGTFDEYEDWCGKVAPASEYPEGTPGEYTRETT